MTWFPLAFFLIHVVEEWRRFPAWATRHFGATSRAWYVYSHIPLVAALYLLGLGASSARSGSAWWLLLTAAVCTLASNALFHLVATVAFREYSPGLVSGLLLLGPLAAWWCPLMYEGGVLDGADLAVAAGLGVATGGLVVASLWLPMDLDWRLRRRR
jgi:hypothetical protein